MISRGKVLALGVASAFLISGATVALAQMNGEQTVKERESLMKGMSANNKIVAAAAKSGQIDDKVTKAAQEISDSAKKIPSLFPAGTGDDKLRTRAKPAIWQEQSTFTGYAKDLENGFSAVASAAKSGDKAAVGAAFAKASQACGSCHKQFRGPELK
jgi:cytochrome c556